MEAPCGAWKRLGSTGGCSGCPGWPQSAVPAVCYFLACRVEVKADPSLPNVDDKIEVRCEAAGRRRQ
jgi:hypothetical protein